MRRLSDADDPMVIIFFYRCQFSAPPRKAREFPAKGSNIATVRG